MIPLRDENPSHRLPFITVLFIILNAFVFFREIGLGPLGEVFILNFGVIPDEVVRHRNLPGSGAVDPYLTILTSMFLHGGWLHLIGNMWFLWIFGDNVEDFLGHSGFLVFYLVCGLIAALSHIVLNPASQVPMVGASGAISGVLGAYIVLHPRIRIQTLMVLGFYVTTVRIPAFFFLGLWFLMQFMGELSGVTSGVAYAAHIGGFVAGVFLVLFGTRKDPRPHERYESIRARRW